MAEYIDRQAFEKALTIASSCGKDKDRRVWAKSICILHDMPNADVAPVRHGRWIERDYLFPDPYYTCSACGEDIYMEETGDPALDLFTYTYCPHCGAKMDERVCDYG